MSSGVAPETCTKLLDTSGALGKREHDQNLEMSTQGHSGKCRFSLFGLAGHFCFVSANHLPGAWTGCASREGTVSLLDAHSE